MTACAVDVAVPAKILQSPPLELFQSISSYPFPPNVRRTVAMLIVASDEILLVQTAKGKNWTIPQGEIIKKDGTLYSAFLRQSYVELGLEDKHVALRRASLGVFENPMPADRKTPFASKLIFVVGVQVHSKSWLRLNPKENVGSRWVRGGQAVLQFLAPMAESRPVKSRAIPEIVNAGKGKGIISWSCHTEEAVTAAQ